MHVIPAEILNGHNKILIDNTASELIVIENAVDQNDIDDNEEMEDLQDFCRKKILLRCDIRIKLSNFGGLDISFSTGNGCDSWEVQSIEARLLLAIRKKEILSQLKVKLMLLFPIVL
jgi:hypothetical protein